MSDETVQPAVSIQAAESRLVPMDVILEPQLPVRASFEDKPLAELVESMAAVGLQCPISVTPRGELYEVVYGHRRFVAAQRLGWEVIPALIIRDEGLSLEARRIHENSAREEMNAAQEAVYYQQLIEKYHLDEAGLCALVKKSADYIARRWALMRGDEMVFEKLLAGEITFAVARALNPIKDESLRRYYLHQAIVAGTSARVVEQWAAQANAVPVSVSAAPAPPATSQEQPAPPVEPEGCHYCGGYRDPQNLTFLRVHKYCQKRIDEVMREATRIEQERGKG